MADMNDIVRVAVDAYRGNVKQYSMDQSQELLQKALVEANNGSTTLNYRDIRDGKCSGLFTLIEQILSRTVVEGIQSTDFFNALVEFRSVPEGDKNVFLVEDNNLLVVADVANGTQGIRRQRLSGVSEVSIGTTRKAIKIYEEMERVLAGRVDFNHMIRVVSESFQAKLLEDIYTVYCNMADNENMGGVTYFPAAGSYDEDKLLELIAHVEASANGKTATVLGTKKALRNLAPSMQGNDSLSDLYNKGFYGTFYGNPVMALPQRHKVNSTEFVMNDNVLTVIAGDSKPIKVVHEGSPLIIMGNPIDNGDLTHEYLYSEKYGTGIILPGGNPGIGRYTMA